MDDCFTTCQQGLELRPHFIPPSFRSEEVTVKIVVDAIMFIFPAALQLHHPGVVMI
jgi:hypothetical protein